MLNETENLEQWIARRNKIEEEQAKLLSETHFAETTMIPDLEFLPPDCPICYVSTEYEDGNFWCYVCNVSWPQNGYGHQATRHTDE